MKTLQFENIAGTITVNYYTDLIGENQEFTVFQAKELVNGVERIGLQNSTIALGFDFNVQPYNLATFKQFAEDNDYILKVYSGSTVTTIYNPVYGAGGIGEEEL